MKLKPVRRTIDLSVLSTATLEAIANDLRDAQARLWGRVSASALISLANQEQRVEDAMPAEVRQARQDAQQRAAAANIERMLYGDGAEEIKEAERQARLARLS